MTRSYSDIEFLNLNSPIIPETECFMFDLYHDEKTDELDEVIILQKITCTSKKLC